MLASKIAVGDHRDLLDIIDSLRSQGVSRFVDLPEIIVCGDQSAGKSSVLEAISSMPFPAKDGVCTRFATELILRRGHDASIKVSITPGETRFGEDKERLEKWQPKVAMKKKASLVNVTEEAKRAMAYPAGTEEFYDDILRIEITGPEQPHLTMVDLPGLFRRGNNEQSDADVEIVRNMVERYMARPRSIILTVVSAKSEYVLQEVTSMAERADPDGLRTLGLITKPDTLDVGSESENYYVRLAQNLDPKAKLRLGWHVLKNRSFEERNVSAAERDAIENDFFSQGLWASLDRSHCGVEALKSRLSKVLRDQILSQLPSLVQDVETGIRDCTTKLDRLGPVRGTPMQQLNYLMQISEEYTSLVTQAVDGIYINPFFGSRKERDRFSRRLRAVVQSKLREFGEEMRVNGQRQYIVDSGGEEEDERIIRDLPRISRSEYIGVVADRLKYSKGRELHGLFNPLIITELFVEQCEPWERLVKDLADDILEAVYETTQLIVRHITANDVADELLQLIRQGIHHLKAEMDAKIDTLLASAAQPPITYNPQLTQNVQQIQQARHKRGVKRAIRKMFGSLRFEDPDSKISLNPIQLVDIMGQGFEHNMDRFGSTLAVDYMEAYYEIAVNRFIDDVSTLAIEDCLVSKLPTLFRSRTVLDMNEEVINRLVGETEGSSKERTRLEEKRQILKTGLLGLKNLLKHRPVANLSEQDRSAPRDSEQTLTVTPPGWSQEASMDELLSQDEKVSDFTSD